MKVCTGCNQSLAFDQFAKRSQSPDGLQHKCKACNKVDNAKFRKEKPQYINDWRVGKNDVLLVINRRYQNKLGGGVYKITNNLTGQFYIGSTKALIRRRNEHLETYSTRNNANKPLFQDVLKYGKDNFTFEIIKQCPIEEARELEAKLIKKLQPHYNVKFKKKRGT